MRAYGGHNLKGISGRRKSQDSAHRRRSLRVDKKRERKRAVDLYNQDHLEVEDEATFEYWRGDPYAHERFKTGRGFDPR